LPVSVHTYSIFLREGSKMRAGSLISHEFI
jgi:hypothetical protein